MHRALLLLRRVVAPVVPLQARAVITQAQPQQAQVHASKQNSQATVQSQKKRRVFDLIDEFEDDVDSEITPSSEQLIDNSTAATPKRSIFDLLIEDDNEDPVPQKPLPQIREAPSQPSRKDPTTKSSTVNLRTDWNDIAHPNGQAVPSSPQQAPPAPKNREPPLTIANIVDRPPPPKNREPPLTIEDLLERISRTKPQSPGPTPVHAPTLPVPTGKDLSEPLSMVINENAFAYEKQMSFCKALWEIHCLSSADQTGLAKKKCVEFIANFSPCRKSTHYLVGFIFSAIRLMPAPELVGILTTNKQIHVEDLVPVIANATISEASGPGSLESLFKSLPASLPGWRPNASSEAHLLFLHAISHSHSEELAKLWLLILWSQPARFNAAMFELAELVMTRADGLSALPSLFSSLKDAHRKRKLLGGSHSPNSVSAFARRLLRRLIDGTAPDIARSPQYSSLWKLITENITEGVIDPTDLALLHVIQHGAAASEKQILQGVQYHDPQSMRRLLSYISFDKKWDLYAKIFNNWAEHIRARKPEEEQQLHQPQGDLTFSFCEALYSKNFRPVWDAFKHLLHKPATTPDEGLFFFKTLFRSACEAEDLNLVVDIIKAGILTSFKHVLILDLPAALELATKLRQMDLAEVLAQFLMSTATFHVSGQVLAALAVFWHETQNFSQIEKYIIPHLPSALFGRQPSRATVVKVVFDYYVKSQKFDQIEYLWKLVVTDAAHPHEMAAYLVALLQGQKWNEAFELISQYFRQDRIWQGDCYVAAVFVNALRKFTKVDMSNPPLFANLDSNFVMNRVVEFNPAFDEGTMTTEELERFRSHVAILQFREVCRSKLI